MNEYIYDLDFNFYKRINDKELKIITRTEYKLKTGETDYIINKIRYSNWPAQINDYFYIRQGKKYSPIDWKLFNIIKYFKKNNLLTVSSHQNTINPCYIQFVKIDINKLNNILNLITIKDNTIYFDFKDINNIHKQLNINLPNHKKAYKGGRIIFPYNLKNYKIIN
jgi:hypothetical protein